MANRSTVKSNIITKNVPTVTNAILTDILNAELADNLRFREDVATLQSSSSSNITVNFTGKDRIDLTRTGGSLNITLSGIGDGETKFLLVTKTAGQVVTFVGVTDITPIKANANAQSIVLYEIVRKSSYYYVKAWSENVKTATDSIEGVLETATQAESNSLSATDKIVTPGRMPVASTTQRGITEHATSAQVDAGTAGNYAVIASELKRKYDAALAYAAGLDAALQARVSALEGYKRVIASGIKDVGDIGSGVIEVAVFTGVPCNSGQKILITIEDPNGYPQDIVFGVYSKGVDNFHVYMKETASHVQDIQLHWAIIEA